MMQSKRCHHKIANAIIAFAVSVFAVLISSLSLANIPSHHFLSHIPYAYDGNGNRLTNTADSLGQVGSYAYDANGNPTQTIRPEGDSTVIACTYDKDGNCTQITRGGYPTDNGTTIDTYDPRGRISERQSPSGTTTYGWDSAGRLVQTQTGTQTTTYTWNAEHQLTEIKRNGVPTANYRYTGGLRDQANQERTVWDGAFAFLKQDPSGNLLTRTEHVGDKALYLSGTAGNEILLRDGLDSITGSVQSGNLQSSTSYGAWGESQQTGTTQSRHGYTGHLYDEETGLIYARARYYDPSIGRFISQDPLEGLQNSPITWNPYVYGNANPLYYTDPSGMASVSTMINQSAEDCNAVTCAGWAFLYEPPRVLRRLNLLREWSLHEVKQIFPGSQRTCRAAGIRGPRRS